MVTLLGLVVVVAQGATLWRLELPTGRSLGSVSLPAPPLALMAAPDGAVFAPLAQQDATAVVLPQGTLVQLAGRLAPLFFREPDRFYALLPQSLEVLSYPERVRVASWPFPQALQATHAACLEDGQAVAFFAGGGRVQVAVVFPFQEGRVLLLEPPLPTGPGWVALSPGFLAAGSGQTLWLAPLGERQGVTVPLAGELRGLVWGAEGRFLYVLVEATGSQLLRLKPPKRMGKQPSLDHLWQGSGQPQALATSAAGLVVLDSEGVSLVSLRGKLLGRAKLEGGRLLAALPERPTFGGVPWSDQAP